MIHSVSDLREQYAAGRSLLDALQGILEAEDINKATAVTSDFVDKLDGKLLSLKFSDSEDETAIVRPFSAYPKSIRQISIAMQPAGRCPFYKESRKRLSPFYCSSIDRTQYLTLNDRIFFREIDRLDFGDILILPVMIGRGIAVTTIGVPGRTHASAAQCPIRAAYPHIVAAFISKFPEVTTLFEHKRLTKLERQVVSMLSKGRSYGEACHKMGLSQTSLTLLLKSASRKLEASNLVEMGIKAASAGELCQTPEELWS
ncbi:helix-turn-helix transcriptional regulator [Salaquimonas pukyongi]|uniref:helix-turn-helix transcriptional regulator n=1 Tax=Salaquimonas pukyongi TaxID=2712698 RepID=UPI0012EC1A88|nr:hypothetical protein [Salaquimonas pukyongi]